MIRMIQSQSAKNAKAYFDESLSKSDYYLNDQELPGRLMGRIRSRMGLDGTATRDVFQKLCDNINPVNGKRLTPRTKSNRTVYYDVNFHVPKSVSVLHVLSKDDHILQAFQNAVRYTMKEIEKDAKTTVRKNGAKEERMTGELLWCEFIHQTARPIKSMPPDPHLHAHCTVLNVTYDTIENRYKAGQFREIKQDMPYYQSLFHKHLADELMRLGYKIKRTRSAFEIIGVPEQVISLFSKRTNEIGQLAKEHNITDERQLDGLGAKTRGRKQKGLTLACLKNEWRKQIMEAGMANGDGSKSPIRNDPLFVAESASPQDCVDFALDQRFERVSVMPERRVIEAACRHAIGKTGVAVETIKAAFDEDRRIIRVQDGQRVHCTTQEALAEEQRMVTLAVDGKGRMVPLYAECPNLSLSGEQQRAVAHVLTTGDFVSVIQGRAGTGKTTLMKEAVKLIEQSGRKVMVVAPTAQASRGVLREEGFKDAETVAKLLCSPEMQDTLTNQVLWVDEAGLIGVKELAALLDLADRKNARVILGGDTRQHASVVRGDALRILQKVAGVIPANVNRIYRQTHEGYRKAVEAIADGRVKDGFDLLNAWGAIRAEQAGDVPDYMAEEYMTSIRERKTVLAVSPTHEQGRKITKAIRDRLQKEGIVSQDVVTLTRLVSLNLTQAEKTDWRNIEPDMILQFSKSPSPDIKRGEKWTVQKCGGNEVELIHESGKKARLCLEKEKNSFELYSKAEMSIAKGDQIVITRNGKDSDGKRLNNGQMLTVTGMDDLGRVLAESGHSKAAYILPHDFGHINHAYCMTSHSSQGKTVDRVLIAQGSETFAASNLKQFYVSVSRGREAVTIFTDDKNALLEKVSQDGDRVSAMELIHKADQSTDTALRTKRLQSSRNDRKDAPAHEGRPAQSVQGKPRLPQTGTNTYRPAFTP